MRKFLIFLLAVITVAGSMAVGAMLTWSHVNPALVIRDMTVIADPDHNSIWIEYDSNLYVHYYQEGWEQ